MTCGMEGTQSLRCLKSTSVSLQEQLQLNNGCPVPGCSVESTTFFAFHKSGVMEGTLFCLYKEIKLLACSKPADETSSVLETG